MAGPTRYLQELNFKLYNKINSIMEPSNNYYPNSQPRQPQQPNWGKLANWLIGLILFICAVLLFSVFFGYGTLKFDVPANSAVFINGKPVEKDSIKLRTGSYDLTIYSPTTKPTKQSVRVWLWGATFSPELEKRSVQSIVASSIGAYGRYGVPVVAQEKWFENNTWLAASVGPGSTVPIALHWENAGWQVKFFNIEGDYPDDVSELPQEMAAYIEELEASHAQ